MSSLTSDTRITEIKTVPSPAVVIGEFPGRARVEGLVASTRGAISRILHGADDRLLVVVGPCSVHDPKSALEYAQRLSALRSGFLDDLEIVMRVYFEKPRTTVGWKGLINDPNLDGSFDINKGIRLARELLIRINELGLPAGTEFLDIVTGQYYSDLVSWGAIGARTTESQVHREMASGLSCPVGFKNGTDGNLQIAIDAVKSSRTEHNFLSQTPSGEMAIYRTAGNADGHIILRGGKAPNYDADSVAAAIEQMGKAKVETGLIVDFSHGNSRKRFERQAEVGRDVAGQVAAGQSGIVGCMIESHLVEGNQKVVPGEPLVYGQSITDACIGFETTESLLRELAEAARKRRRGRL
ncbi:3-deoxy-7-phosphoheptulonate synthase [Pelagicoccus sp. NFK12]|uniref:Phospho-2-dehydro-3-deoxyheptonate aldolase n=1 Tax=Pelagicoccus enzymogenes TaxID=2773457 RepID=A0A927FCV1_9BACT|nr:3-deoxy-7-phosphoheptulonate synthase [Pelagicoccus enzymogenes]MBD5782059.1 3-deoxy-7-phosphoheptulonate synthase [Pelagicoccus enzymogenes]MDQ8196813.1 3-deoxy-7-phosphoheptulonate synthase [Pelagicoccus enzymogenes]